MTTSLQTSLHTLLGKLATDTWENLREARCLDVRFGEETITDILMLELRRNGFTAFKQTPLQDEAKYGTDFECWLGSKCTGWIGFAIQSKKLAFRPETYRNLGHVVKGPKKRQFDILKAYAQARGLTPRYCLYSHSLNVEPAFLSCCSRSFSEEELGCTLTPLDAVARAIAVRGCKNFRALQKENRTVPWRCLASCPRLHNSLKSKSISSSGLSPLLDIDSRIFPELPCGLSLLQKRQREVQSRDPDDLREEGEEGVDFEQLRIGVHSSELDIDREDLPSFIIPKRVYIFDLTDCPTGSECKSRSGGVGCAGTC